MNHTIDDPKGAFFICPEMASPQWTIGFNGSSVLYRYQKEIFMALILGKTLLAPARLPELLQQEY